MSDVDANETAPEEGDDIGVDAGDLISQGGDLADEEVEVEELDGDDDADEEEDDDEDDDEDDELDELRREAQAAILRAIPTLAGGGDAEGVLDLAEAFAWLEEPEQDHGG